MPQTQTILVTSVKTIKNGVAPSSGNPWVLSEIETEGETYSTFLSLDAGNTYEVEIEKGKYKKSQIIKARIIPQNAHKDSRNLLVAEVGPPPHFNFEAELFQTLRRIEDQVADIYRIVQK